jgi:hypothetical protein
MQTLGALYMRPQNKVDEIQTSTESSRYYSSAHPTMPPRLVFSSVCRSLAIRTRPSIRPPQIIRIAARRGFADGDRKDPSQNAFGSVSEEAAHISKVTGGEGPEISQGTPVQDVSFVNCSPRKAWSVWGTIYPENSRHRLLTSFRS